MKFLVIHTFPPSSSLFLLSSIMLAKLAYMQVSADGGSDSCWGWEEVTIKAEPEESGTGRMDGDIYAIRLT